MCLTYVIIERCAGVCEQASRGGLGLGGDALLMVCAAVVLAGGIAAPVPGVAESGGPVEGVGSRNAVPCLPEFDSPVTLWGGLHVREHRVSSVNGPSSPLSLHRSITGW
jgi:hypothetical protein